MYQISTLKNGLTLITINLPRLDSVTTLVAVGAGSRYETKKINGISHFLEHMFFKGSKKYPTAEIIATLIDQVGAINNAMTAKEFTSYWIKSSAKHLELACDILSSLLKEPLFSTEEIEREKGVIVEELRMYKDRPLDYIWDLYEELQFGNQPLGWHIGGDEITVTRLIRNDFVRYMNSLYSPSNMALVYAGKIPQNIQQLAEKYFLHLPARSKFSAKPYQKHKQTKIRSNIFYKKTDQAHVVLGVEGYNRYDKKRYAAGLLGVILGEGMSSRLFIQIRERRGLAYVVRGFHEPYTDTGLFAVYAGLKLEKIEEGLQVIKSEILKLTKEPVSEEELNKAKEMVRGRLAIRSESTNFLAEHFGTEFVLDRKLESFDEYLRKINAVTTEEVQLVAQELFQPQRFNLQVIGPFKSATPFEKILNS